MAGRLLLIATPLGNLEDVTPRMISAFRSCDVLLCEDTRHTGRLLHHLGIDVRTESFHEHNEDAKVDRIIARIREGETIGVASDAGMPVLSDPGFPLVRRAREEGLTVEPVAGPFAGALALVASGLAPVPFAFYGFTPHRSGDRREFFRGLPADMTVIVYESPQRLVESLEDLLEVVGDVDVTVAREMTKMHEEFLHGTAAEVLANLRSRDQIRGEITLVIGPHRQSARTATEDEIRAEFLRLREQGMRRTDATRVIAERHGLRKRDLYGMLLGED